jgi:1-aminocyclopropane-1-carboxylate deaminase/D-cysteine desulfhydrase-like pyridoxal-dependent ACC family enzyme
MEACNSGLRSFNRQVALAVLREAKKRGVSTIIELGAGRAPVTSELARMAESAGLQTWLCINSWLPAFQIASFRFTSLSI